MKLQLNSRCERECAELDSGAADKPDGRFKIHARLGEGNERARARADNPPAALL